MVPAYLNQTGQDRTSSVDDFNAMAFVLLEHGESPPGTESPRIRTTTSKKSKRENLPFHNEVIIARFSDFLHQLCSGMIEHPLRLSFVVAQLNKGRYGSTTSAGVV